MTANTHILRISAIEHAIEDYTWLGIPIVPDDLEGAVEDFNERLRDLGFEEQIIVELMDTSAAPAAAPAKRGRGPNKLKENGATQDRSLATGPVVAPRAMA